ncbi:alpha/beta fold hydrolase [Spirulina subsalsa]|uniref:alpha/beta fold hydrolase n=1 Tax=Spirulina subsalsa TaxID=54311 RepID=UPI0002E42FFE|nr:alpha/beta fold hydrolase [Spirulina subsalsa]
MSAIPFLKCRILAYSFLSLTTVLLTRLPLKAQSNASGLNPSWQRIDCPFVVPQGEAVDCGWLTVPENRQVPSSAEIQVFFARVYSYSSRPAPDPVVILGGGPGQGMSDGMSAVWQGMLSLRRDRDLIIIDPRGTGQSHPPLTCEEFKQDYPPEVEGGNAAEYQWLVQQTVACRDRLLQQNIDLQGYTTTQTALDLRDLRQALNIPQWNLIGTSYGTKLALETLRQDPTGIRTIVFNSMMTLGDAWSVDTLSYTLQAFEQLLRDCERQPTCQTAYPNLRQAFRELQKRLNETPLTLSWYDTTTGQLHQESFTFQDIVDTFIFHLSFIDTLENLPYYIHRLHQLINGKRNLRDDEIMSIFSFPDFGINDGVYFSVMCHEVYPLSAFDQTQAFSRQHSQWFRPEGFYIREKRQCQAWNVPPVSPQFTDPITSDIPVLFLSGNYDVLTPPLWTEEIRQNFPNASVIQIPFMGHDVLNSSLCVQSFVADYIKDPRHRLETHCIVQHAPRFVTE